VRHYELMWILGAASSEADGTASVERVKALVTSRGGQVPKAEFWARRTMAYPVKGNREGAYFVARFSVDGRLAPEIERAIYHDQAIIRHILVRVEEVEETAAVAPAGPARSESREPAPAVAVAVPVAIAVADSADAEKTE
jgi:small subunit ribosomal protein S6